MKHNIWAADCFWFRISGKQPQRFISMAANSGIHLAHLHYEKDAFTAQAFGSDHAALQKLAKKGNWDFSVLHRKGPGRFLEFLLGRPGLPVGALLFFLLIQQLTAFVWTIDFGTLDSDAQTQMRTLLAECGVQEGTYLDTDTLQKAQTAALQQSDTFGWISLNFTDGGLWIESTPAETQTIREDAPLQPLYAREDGEILAIETQSGFTLVKVGDQVEKGQLLVDVSRLDRDGNVVMQGASGNILARIEKSYTAIQPYKETKIVLTGQSNVREQLTLVGFNFPSDTAAPPSEALLLTQWEPLRLGRLSLPGCLCKQTYWQQSAQSIHYTQEQAQALALRACRAQLFAEFPDAQIESEQRSFSQQAEGTSCTITYRFFANLATPSV